MNPSYDFEHINFSKLELKTVTFVDINANPSVEGNHKTVTFVSINANPSVKGNNKTVTFVNINANPSVEGITKLQHFWKSTPTQVLGVIPKLKSL